MLSSIKVDYVDPDGKGQRPAITVRVISSDDVRDTMLQTLFQSGGELTHLKAHFMVGGIVGNESAAYSQAIVLTAD